MKVTAKMVIKNGWEAIFLLMTGKMPATLFKYTRMTWTGMGIGECISDSGFIPHNGWNCKYGENLTDICKHTVSLQGRFINDVDILYKDGIMGTMCHFQLFDINAVTVQFHTAWFHLTLVSHKNILNVGVYNTLSASKMYISLY
jgi:hypothetical protein